MMNLHIFSSLAQVFLPFDLVSEGYCSILFLVDIEDLTQKNVTIYSASQIFYWWVPPFSGLVPRGITKRFGLSPHHSALWNVLWNCLPWAVLQEKHPSV